METFTFYSSGTSHRWCNFYPAWYPTIEATSKGYPNASRTGLVVMFTFMLPVSRFVPFSAFRTCFYWSTIQYGLHRAGEAHRAHRHRMLLVVKKKRGTALVFVFAVCIGNDFQPSQSVKRGPLELMHIPKCTCNQKREKHHHFARERLEKMQHKSSFQVYANHCRRVDKKRETCEQCEKKSSIFSGACMKSCPSFLSLWWSLDPAVFFLFVCRNVTLRASAKCTTVLKCLSTAGFEIWGKKYNSTAAEKMLKKLQSSFALVQFRLQCNRYRFLLCRVWPNGRARQDS